VTEIPHFSLPFRFATPQVAVSEQDSIDEIADCVLAILLTPAGMRIELPEFGIVDPTFQQMPVDLAAISDAVDAWEPRAATVLSDEQLAELAGAALNPATGYPDELAARIGVIVQVRSEE
jgi:phage baseplate assembly protein W